MALLGCGVVGSEVARLIIEQAEDLRARVGRPLELVGIAVRRDDRDRPGIDPALFTTDAEALVTREDVDLVIEVIGGIEPARSLILAALRHGASVVTANKALLAEDGAALFEAAERAGADLYFEAAVAGAIPIIRPLRESLVGDEITSVIGIVNGTTNYILDRMDTAGIGFAEALAEAQSSATRRPIRRQTSRASTPQPRRRSWRAWRSTLGSPARMSTGKASPGSPQLTSPRRMTSAAWSSCWQSASYPHCCRRCRPNGVGAGPSGDDSALPPARRGWRRVQRGVRRVDVCRTAHVLRSWCRGVRLRRVPFWGTLSRWPGTGCAGPSALASPATRHAPSARSAA